MLPKLSCRSKEDEGRCLAPFEIDSRMKIVGIIGIVGVARDVTEISGISGIVTDYCLRVGSPIG